MEDALQSRGVQRREAQQIGEAWGGVRAVVGCNPRLFKKGLMLDMLEPALPELYKTKCPVKGPRQFQLRNSKSVHYLDEKTLREDLELEELSDLDKEVLNIVVRTDSRTMWDHDGLPFWTIFAVSFRRC